MKNPSLACPTCNKTITYSPDNLFRPFCSERCKLIDLGAWAAEEHVIHEQIDYLEYDEYDMPSTDN